MESNADGEAPGDETFCFGGFLLAFIPIFLVGTFLGVLVIFGQASKPGMEEKLTAFVLFADVAFKVGATAAAEMGEYFLHVRVRRAIERRNAAVHEVAPQSVGSTDRYGA